jgi:hypothetical protein
MAQHASHPIVGLLSGLRELSRQRFVQLAVLTAALSALTWYAFLLKYSVRDLDLYWHLAVGDWIVQHGSVPHTGILSRTAADLPWMAYSWGSEVLLSRAYAWFGLLGLGGYGSALIFMAALALWWSLQRLSEGFWSALAIWGATCYGALFSLMPRPVFFSMTFYVVELTLILEVERSGEARRLWWLPPLFLLWANLHIQFIYGLFLLGLMTVPPVLHAAARLHPTAARWMQAHSEPSRLRLPQLGAVLAACVAVTCIGPYSYHLYEVVIGYSRAKLTYSTILELQPVSFTYAEQYVPLLITAAAFFALGQRKHIATYQMLLLIAATLVSLRTERDTWFICLTAAMILAESLGSMPGRLREIAPARRFWLETAGVGTAWVLCTLLIAQNTNFNSRELNRAISATFPVDACNYLRRTQPPGPMYNSFNWGGFLTWYLPMYPVVVDGRNDLYDGPLGETLVRTQAEPGFYRKNPYLNESGFVLVEAKDDLDRQLSLDPGYRRVYTDEQAEIFVHSGQ